ncbi:hypothetical protein M9H77_17244 [Catharanthus roseus]|uniref:Uncharacterized protein n=1 Tax=Catharanthus roseus TaxID=4058 RepID=A0ACC0B427_CATRO|nr:hypothetical protein M9H77_17244 [Catharanthus roseus]
MVSIGGTLGCTPSQHDIQQTFQVQSSRRRPQKLLPDQGACGVKRGARRLPGRGARDGRLPIPPFPSIHGHADLEHEVERGEGSGGGRPPVDPFDSPTLDMPSFSLGLTPSFQSLPGGSRTVCPISLTTPYIFRVFIVSCTSSSRHSRFIYTASAYIACIFI